MLLIHLVHLVLSQVDLEKTPVFLDMVYLYIIQLMINSIVLWFMSSIKGIISSLLQVERKKGTPDNKNLKCQSEL